jgi:SAM-dependent methyltransferase
VFQEGDASDLHDLDDDSFGMVVSIFGAMFAPKPYDVAKEMVRVTRPGGRIVMGNWIPGDPTLVAQILRICGAYSPPPPEGFVSPMTWGVEADVIDRFSAAGIPPDRVSFRRLTYRFRFDTPPAHVVTLFRDFYGPTMNAFVAASAKGGFDRLQRQLDELFASQNTSAEPGITSIPATYLQVDVAV